MIFIGFSSGFRWTALRPLSDVRWVLDGFSMGFRSVLDIRLILDRFPLGKRSIFNGFSIDVLGSSPEHAIYPQRVEATKRNDGLFVGFSLMFMGFASDFGWTAFRSSPDVRWIFDALTIDLRSVSHRYSIDFRWVVDPFSMDFQ